MPTLSWTEIRQRAIQFSREWSEETREHAEAQTFWNDFFHVFGMKRRQVASFEERVKSIKGQHRIDLFWKGKLLAEHKSRGEDLSKATSQAFNYIQELINEDRRDECPRYVAISDFARIVLYDLEPDDQLELPRANLDSHFDIIEIPVAEFHKHIKHFAFVAGLKTQRLREQDPANLKAVKLMARLHDALAGGGYAQPELERLLVRLLFCLFADDTGVFEPDSFELFIENRTRADGYDLGPQLARLFKTLDTPEDQRGHIHDEELLAFPYINGELFSERLDFAEFNADMRNALLAACRFEWSRISPAIFGSLFQGVMQPKERRQIGAHYTSERDILKLIGPLFLDQLTEELHQIAKDRSTRKKQRLEDFQRKLAKLTFLDPACGCGNFLVIAYRELRRLELQALNQLHDAEEVQQLTAIELQTLSQVDVDQFYGIEIDMWPSRIAETALWLTDHQMNRELSEAFGQIFLRIPLKKSPHIHCANALTTPWETILPPERCSYILGNPPFIGGKYQSKEQKADLKAVAGDIKGHGLLDFVSLWYLKAADYMQTAKGREACPQASATEPQGREACPQASTTEPPATTNATGTARRHGDMPPYQAAPRAAFVSTNSITMGEQVGVLWPALFAKGVHIHFAHRTFSWQSEASGAAHVHVVIIGFALHDTDRKTIYEYEDIKGEPKAVPATQINPYLIDGPRVAICNRSNPLCQVPEIGIGNKPIDGGYYLFTPEEKKEFLRIEPKAEPLFRRWIGSKEYINGIERWCLFLIDVPPQVLRALPEVTKRIESVAKFRKGEMPAKGKEDTPANKKRDQATQKLGDFPTTYHVTNLPTSEYLVLPEVSSERRHYIPIGYMSSEVVASNLVKLIPDATPYHFGVLSSAMHMAWVRQVCGRLESRYRYSAKLVYNNYPWPVEASEAQQERIAEAAQGVLDARQKYLDAGSTLADLYDPLTMPADLLKAHQALDAAVDKAYRGKKFDSERERVEYLFAQYEKLNAPLMPQPKKKAARRRKTT